MKRHDETVERALVGGVLNRADAFAEIDTPLARTDFGDDWLGRVWEAARGMWLAQEAVDPALVAERIGAEGEDYRRLLECVRDASMTTGLERHAQVVAEYRRRRRMSALGAELGDLLEGGGTSADCDAAIGRAGEDDSRGERGVTHVSTSTVMEDYFTTAEAEGPRFYVTAVDRRVAPMQPGQVVVVAARPSIGKTAVAVHACLRNAERGRRCLLLSLEMGERDIDRRMVANLSGTPVAGFYHRNLSGHEQRLASEAEAKLAALPIWRRYMPSPTLADVAHACRQAARLAKGPLDLVAIDYLGLMRSERAESRQAEVAALSRGVKALAGQLAVPVLLLAQVNRDPERRVGEGKRPQLADLRDSGQIEADADAVLMLYRDEFYNERTPEPGVMEVDIVKQRQGPTGLRKAGCDMASGRLFDLEAL